MKDYNLLVKKLRAEVIKEHLNGLGKNNCVCFTSGNATKYLRDTGLEVISVGDNEELKPGKWFSYTEIQKSFNGLFDATSGHLPFPLMNNISNILKDELKDEFQNEEDYNIKIGSGETIVCLKMAFPYVNFKPQRIKGFIPTTYNAESPMNNLVYALFKDVKGGLK